MTKKILSSVFCGALICNNSIGMIPKTQAAEPYQKTFIVTAYYSPLPDQKFYVTGSLAGDKRLNGNGTNGADGTPVYPGMIAAPGTYAFGTRISCPPYIDGEIHDRGGAIVKAGVRNNAHDRLDFWAGHGDDALKTALYWGKRTLTCTVYPPGYAPAKQYVSLPQGKLSDFAASFLKKPQSTPGPQSTVASSEAVPEKYQALLKDLGYEPDDQASRIAFQMRHDIIKDESDPSAGNIGPQSRAKLDEIAQSAAQVPREGLEEGSVDADVRLLQEMLVKLGYLEEKPTAIFGEKTKEALIKFQLEKGVIDSKDHPAAGYVGPGTQSALKKEALGQYRISTEDLALISKIKSEASQAEAIAIADKLAAQQPTTQEASSENQDELYQLLQELSQEWVKEHTPEEHSENAAGKVQIELASAKVPHPLSEVKEKLAPIFNPFDHSLRLGAKHRDVEIMQKLLKANGFFQGEQITDYFGPQTKKAVAEFQVKYGIVTSAHSTDAGIVGPKTIKALNALYYQNEFSFPIEISSKIRAPAIHPSDLTKPLQQASTTAASKS